ncbi:glucose-6-phosphate isomerase [Alkaliphilus transvaalensis]|uniref:glucose-6-phosphate isomerase n=1 Tax=Alkaliphilus transvaalensis TaxID=114628 RepID=UPI000479C7A3|nr:glucose-6-phosphate isomerase [Alkaliphilus transvaalensis]
MNKITFDYSKSMMFFSKDELDYLKPMVAVAHKMLHEKKGAGKEYIGWLELPNKFDPFLVKKIKATAVRIQDSCDALVVIGIGGSYLGARSAIELLNHHFYNQLSKDQRKTPEIYFVGHNISATYLQHLLQVLEGKEICINVISKSGTTTEPAIAFRFFKELLEKKYGKAGAKDRIIATTDAKKGALKQMADEEGYKTFVIPDDIGGRYSVLTPVGLLPMAVAGIDIEEVLLGARAAYKDAQTEELEDNQCYQYAAIRNILYRKGKTVEVLVNYEPSLHYFGEWWKQLYGESEGKDFKGIFPASVNFSTDLHSMGQYIQQGLRNIFETVLVIGDNNNELLIQVDDKDLDGLNYLAGKSIDYVNSKAYEGTLLAHQDGGVPNLVINIPKKTPYYYGYLVYFFEKACGISGYLLGVNPFDQPGVEDYKRNMFALLGKPGYEKQQAELLSRL